jgi:hypothetical protein
MEFILHWQVRRDLSTAHRREVEAMQSAHQKELRKVYTLSFITAYQTQCYGSIGVAVYWRTCNMLLLLAALW